VAHHERLQKPVSIICLVLVQAVLTLPQVKDETSKETPAARGPSEGYTSELAINMSTAELKLGKSSDENVQYHRMATPEPSKSQSSLLLRHIRTKSLPLDKEDAPQAHETGVEPTVSNLTPGSDARGTPELRAQPREKEKDQGKRKPAGPNEPFEQWERDEMEALLNEVQGHLGESLLGILNNGFLTATTSYFSDTFLGGRGYCR
jgi:hypothetical protein